MIKLNYRWNLLTRLTGVVFMFAVMTCLFSKISLSSNKDSLHIACSGTKDPITKVEIINDIYWIYISSGDYDSAQVYAKQMIEISKEHNYIKGAARGFGNLGTVHFYKSEFLKALEFYAKSLKHNNEIGDKKGVSDIYNNIGNVYYNQGSYSRAVEYYMESMKIKESTGNKSGLGSTYNNIANIYQLQGNFDKAMEYRVRSLKVDQEAGDKQGIAQTYGNIANIFCERGYYEEGLKYLKKSLALKIETGFKKGIAATYNNMGSLFILLHKKGPKKNHHLDSSLFYVRMALDLGNELSDKFGLITSYSLLGEIAFLKTDYNQSLVNYKNSEEMALNVNAQKELFESYQGISNALNSLGRVKESFEYYKKFIGLRDSVQSRESKENTIREEMKLTIEKKQIEHEKEQEKQEIIYNTELKEQRLQRSGLIAGMVLLLSIAGISYFSYRNKKKDNSIIVFQKNEMEHQKNLVEMKNKDILDSINYAKRIQQAVLKQEEHITKHLPSHFVFFKPKDIVSGDFYWSIEKQGHWYLAVADCTGHGVPGGFMSMLGIAFLNVITGAEHLFTPGEILDVLREKVTNELSQGVREFYDSNTKDSIMKDGMDVSIFRLNLNTLEFIWAGANNSVYIISGKTKNFIELKPDKQPVGFHPDPKPFTDKGLTLEKGSFIYLFTDGYPDQFGLTADEWWNASERNADIINTGKRSKKKTFPEVRKKYNPEGRKFKYNRFKKLIADISEHPVQEQKTKLNQIFDEWKGDLEQVDDVCIVGVKV